MSIPVQFYTVVVPTNTINEKYPGGIGAYRSNCPNATYRTDGLITGVSFMARSSLAEFCDQLLEKGLCNTRKDYVITTLYQGSSWYVPWLQMSDNGEVSYIYNSTS